MPCVKQKQLYPRGKERKKFVEGEGSYQKQRDLQIRGPSKINFAFLCICLKTIPFYILDQYIPLIFTFILDLKLPEYHYTWTAQSRQVIFYDHLC